ncbi:hypothetical protein [Luteolibacter sp. AS25]|uniref:hypothetical protein n=1 Tax=Luteolibacter sp. AS25 TaxID=3135776 RepID=UPI00398B4AEC
MRRSIVSWLLVLVAALLLSSCFDSREEVWINADASGAARITITLPAVATRLNGGEAGVKKMIGDYLSESPQFSSYIVKSEQTADGLEFDVIVTFDNVMELRKLSESPAAKKLPSGSASFMGKTHVEFEKLNVNFKRSVELSKAVPGAIFMPRSQLAGHTITTIIHLPLAATSHNAHTVSEGGRTLTWETPLATAFLGPVETTFIMPLPIPWSTIIMVTTLLVSLSVFLIYYFLRRKKARSTKA